MLRYIISLARRRSIGTKTSIGKYQVTALLAAGLLLAACNQLWMTQPGDPPAGIAPTATMAQEASSAPSDGGAGEPDNRQVVLWMPDFSGLAADDNAGNILTSAFHQFEQANPGTRVDAQVKAESGISSLVNYLRSGQRAAPSIMPDVALVNTQHLWQLADLGLITEISPAELGQFGPYYQFARDAVTYNDLIYGIPYAADILHVAYYLDQLETPPTTWSELFSGEQEFLFPGSGGDGFQNASILLQYIGAGGQLLEDGSISNPEALEAVFEFLVEGRIRGIIPSEVADLASLNAVWTAFISGGRGVAASAADTFLENRDGVPQVHFGQVPTRNGLHATIADTWAFVILTEDPAQREQVLALLKNLMVSTVQGAWGQYTRRLPSNQQAMAEWTATGDYQDFLNRQLEVAVALPNSRAFDEFSRRLQAAQLGVLTGQLTAEEAVRQVRASE